MTRTTCCHRGDMLSLFLASWSFFIVASCGLMLRVYHHRQWVGFLARLFLPRKQWRRAMLLELVPEWTMDIDRGPDWLFVRLSPPRHGDTGEIPLAEMIWQ